MSWAQFAIEKLQKGETTKIRPRGHSDAYSTSTAQRRPGCYVRRPLSSNNGSRATADTSPPPPRERFVQASPALLVPAGSTDTVTPACPRSAAPSTERGRERPTWNSPLRSEDAALHVPPPSLVVTIIPDSPTAIAVELLNGVTA